MSSSDNKKTRQWNGEIIEPPQDGLLTEKIPAQAKLKPFKDQKKLNYPWFINGIINRLNNGFAPVIVICGSERMGKSTMAVDIAYKLSQVNALDIDLGFNNIREHLAYDPEGFLEIVTEKAERNPVLVDEAGVVASSQDAMTKSNKMIRKAIQMMGYKNNVYIFILPNFSALDKEVRNKVDVKIELYERGKAKITGVKTNYGKMRTREYDFNKQILPAYWMHDFKPDDGFSFKKEIDWMYQPTETGMKKKEVEDIEDFENPVEKAGQGRFEDDDKHEIMMGYDLKEKNFKQNKSKQMLEELRDEADDGEDGEEDFEF